MFSKTDSKKEALIDDNEIESSYHEMVQPSKGGSVQYVEVHENEDFDGTNNKKTGRCGCCSWKKCCLGTTLTLTLIIISGLLWTILSFAPRFAQETLDNAQMDVLGGSIYNPTNSSVTMNTTIMVSNAGMVDGTLHSIEVIVSNEDIEIGRMVLPELNTVGGQNIIISITSILTITNVTQFQKSTKSMLQNEDQTWHLYGVNAKLTVANVDFTVDINQDLILKGTKLYDFVASDMDIIKGSKDSIESRSNLEFISDSIFEFVLPDSLMNVYFDDVYIGYSPLSAMSMVPGLNSIQNQSIIIVKTEENEQKLNDFFSAYLHGTDQEVVMRGPVSNEELGYPPLVLENVMEQTVNSLGYGKGDAAFGGLVTSATQSGWKGPNGDTLRGAYANFLNPLSVPVNITYLQAEATMPRTLKYHVTIAKWIIERDCTAKKFANMRIGPGIWKDDLSKSWVGVPAKERATYFAIVDAPEGYEGACGGIYPFNCCFAALSAAYACAINPNIQKDVDAGQLTQDYMNLNLDANVTMQIDNAFEISVTTSQDFLPLYFGWQVYGGYMTDGYLNCKSFKDFEFVDDDDEE